MDIFRPHYLKDVEIAMIYQSESLQEKWEQDQLSMDMIEFVCVENQPGNEKIYTYTELLQSFLFQIQKTQKRSIIWIAILIIILRRILNRRREKKT